jgi:hypothetical protein
MGAAAVVFDDTSGSLFWSRSSEEINVALGNRLAPGTWNLAVRNARGVTPAVFAVVLE